MGLISWIKAKYYNSRLAKADRLVSECNLNEAEEIYRSLLGKQDYAVVHLADMYVSHSQHVEDKLSALKNIENLNSFKNEQNNRDYEKCLSTHVSNIEMLANDRFKGKSYHEAVLLIDAIQVYRKNNGPYAEKRHRYHAYLVFSQSQLSSTYKQLINEAIAELKLYEDNRTSDIKTFANLLKSKNQYSRMIQLLIPFISLNKECKQLAIKAIVNVVLGKDADVKQSKTISEFCPDNSLCKEAATELVSLSVSYAMKSDFKTSVLLDNFATDYFSSENSFNNTRCIHLLEELSGRADATEINQLLKLAQELNLTISQIDSLKNRIAKIAEATSPHGAIEICRLFKSEKVFNQIYVKQAENLVANGEQQILNNEELKKVIQNITDDDSIVDALIPFVHIPFFEKLFLKTAISKIQRHKKLSFLDKYWKVKESSIYFVELISPTSDIAKEVVQFLSSKHRTYLRTAESRKAFCKSIESLNDNKYTFGVYEDLILNKCDVNRYYVELTIKEIKALKSIDAISIINHAISVLPDSQLLEPKKQIIRRLISEKEFNLSEKEAKSIVGMDKEAETILAEVYYNKGLNLTEASEKKECYYLVLDLCETGNVNHSFCSSKECVLQGLVIISRNAYNDGNEQNAFEIVDRIRGYQVYWLPLFINLRNRNLSKVCALGQKIRFEEDTLSQIDDNFDNTKEIKDDSYFKLWDSYIELVYNKSQSQPKEKAIESFIKVRDNVIARCNVDYAKNKVSGLTKDIVRLEWSCAIEHETDIEYDKAISYYEAIKLEDVPSYKGRAELRALICCVKSGSIDSSIEHRILCALNLKSHEALKDDLTYRYACYLLQSTRPSEAEALLKNYLPNELELLALCKNVYIKESEGYLLDFNTKIRSIIDGTMSVDEALQFLNEIDQYKDKISNTLIDTASKFNSYKSKLESYILRGFFNEEQYEKAFEKLLSMYPYYIKNDNQFRNVAIASLGLVESGTTNDRTLKYAISIWLSAVYTDRLFVKSLDYTSWDNNYTFTLQGSLGKTNDYDYDNLPDNINFDDPIDNHNIAIKDVQVSLASRMETYIRDNYPKLEEFYTEEKDALDRLMELNLDQDCTVATPYLSRQLSIVQNSIKNALDYEISQEYDNEEDVLNLGVRYGFTSKQYSAYKETQQKVEICKKSITGSVNSVCSAFSCLPEIRDYSKLYASLKSFVSNRMNEDIKSKLDYKKFIDVYEVVCKEFDEAPLSLAFSHYTNGEIIKRLNADTMELRDGVGYMVRIYQVAPSSIEVKQNLEGMLTALVVQAEQNNSRADKSAVNSALLSTGNTFKSIVEDARIQASLSVIVDKVNSHSMEKDKALKEVYEIYKKNPNNDRICENLVTLCDICIMEYIVADKWGASSVKSVLNSLNNNKSASFNKHKEKLAQSYFQIWNQLSAENRMLMMGLGGYGTSLNNKGLALKEGLEYYKKLGDVRSSRGLGSLFDLP